jgi:hypothetical protein
MRALPEKGNQLAIPAEVIWDSQWERHIESGATHSLKKHLDGSFRVCRNGLLDNGVIIDYCALKADCETALRTLGNGGDYSRRLKLIDRLLLRALTRVQTNAGRASMDIAAALTGLAGIAGDHIATAGGAA